MVSAGMVGVQCVSVEMCEVLAVGCVGGGIDGSPVMWVDEREAFGVQGGAMENATIASAEALEIWGRGDVKILWAKAAWEMS